MTRSSSPVRTRPSWSTATSRSASPSRARPRSAPSFKTASARASGCVEPHASLMLEPSGSPAITLTVAPRRSRTPGATSQPAPFAQSITIFRPSRAPGSTMSDEVVRVLLGRVGIARQAADRVADRQREVRARGRRGSVRSSSSTVGLDRVGKLQAPGCEELHPVVGERVVGSRHHRCGQRAPVGEPRHSGRRKDAEVDDVGALARHARRRAPPAASALSGGCRARSGTIRRGAPVLRRDRAREQPRGSALRWRRRGSHRCRTGRPLFSISASSTEEPYGPSSGRTSCSPSRGRPRVSRPARLRLVRSSGSMTIRALVIPRRRAPAWPETPPPSIVASMS